MKSHFAASRPRHAFTLVEVVLALGVIAIAITAILALFPVALTTGHSAQNATRAAQIAHDVMASIASQAQSASANISQPPGYCSGQSVSSFSYSVSLGITSTPSSPNFHADNCGNLTQNAATATYDIYIFTNSSPAGFASGSATEVTVRVATPGNAAVANQTNYDYTRIVSKY